MMDGDIAAVYTVRVVLRHDAPDGQLEGKPPTNRAVQEAIEEECRRRFPEFKPKAEATRSDQ